MEVRTQIILRLLTSNYVVAQFPPSWRPDTVHWHNKGVVSLTITPDEWSLICAEEEVPSGGVLERGWRLFEFVGPFAFNETGILSVVLSPLAKAGISIMAFSTYNTDYLMVKAENLTECVQVFDKTEFIMLELPSE
ncbi:MAG TPA: ACT domain-containing protein [Rhodothermales bacterium]|nr:ACT domain-containing protein [Rhodothermales bacterium]HRR07717.1 ACT domain-containing protein [Rhodothermales bacterium]